MVALACRYCSCSLSNSVSGFLSNLLVTYSDVDLCVRVIYSPVRAVCSNYELVVFHPWTWTAKYLGSVTSITPFILALLPHLFHPFFRIVLFSSSVITPTPTSKCSLKYHIYLLYPLPTSSPRTKHLPTGRRSHPPPVRLRHSTLRPTPRDCICRRFPRPFAPSLLPSACYQVPINPGRFYRHGYLRPPCASASPYLYSASTRGIFWLLVSCQVTVFARGREARESPLPGNTPPPPDSW